MSDPTLEALAELDDPRRYHVRRNVPVFIPHKLVKTDRHGKKHTIEVTEADLHEIARTANQREHESGTLAVVTLGHRLRDPEAPEWQQPPIVGYARNWRVGVFGPSRKRCLLCDEFVRQEYRKEAGTYVFRSAEYYPNRREITAVCKLRRDPELDLGMVTYGADEPCLLYSREVQMADPTMPPDAADDAALADPTPAPAPAEPDGDEQAREDYMKHCYSHPYAKQYHDGMMAKYGMAAPGPMNGDLPAEGPPPAPAPGEGPEQFQRRLEATRYQREMNSMKARLDAAEKREREAEHRSRLLNYQRELENRLTLGIDLDVAEELSDVRDLTDAEQFQRQTERNLAKIDKRYGRDLTSFPQVPVLQEPPKAREFSERDLETALAYQREQTEKTGQSPTWDQCRDYAMSKRK